MISAGLFSDTRRFLSCQGEPADRLRNAAFVLPLLQACSVMNLVARCRRSQRQQKASRNSGGTWRRGWSSVRTSAAALCICATCSYPRRAPCSGAGGRLPRSWRPRCRRATSTARAALGEHDSDAHATTPSITSVHGCKAECSAYILCGAQGAMERSTVLQVSEGDAGVRAAAGDVEASLHPRFGGTQLSAL